MNVISNRLDHFSLPILAVALARIDVDSTNPKFSGYFLPTTTDMNQLFSHIHRGDYICTLQLSLLWPKHSVQIFSLSLALICFLIHIASFKVIFKRQKVQDHKES